MGKTFTNRGYSVTVNDDRSIDVKPGDWISKYAAAIYGDPQLNWDRFMKKQGDAFAPLDDPNLIIAGQKVYHPERLPGEAKYIEFPPRKIIGRRPKDQMEPSRLRQWLKWLGELLCPVNEWSFKGSGGAELSASVFAGQYFTIGAKRDSDAEETWYHGVGVGGSLGPESIWGSFTMSTTEDFFSDGFIGKFPTAGTRLSKDEICGAYVVLDFGASCFVGWSGALLLFGFNLPPGYVIRNIVRYLTGDSIMYPQHILPMGLIAMHGFNAGTPNIGLSVKAGWMHRLECIPGFGP